MARTFRRQRQTHPIAEMNLTNLIDLGFTLLIIFMIATPLINQEQTIPVNLPFESKKPQTKPDTAAHFVSISIDARGDYHLENHPGSVSLDELRDRLRSYAAEPRPPTVRIRCDRELPYGKFIALMDELGKFNLHSVTFDTQTGP
jgi:biopolymer transport protein TolR